MLANSLSLIVLAAAPQRRCENASDLVPRTFCGYPATIAKTKAARWAAWQAKLRDEAAQYENDGRKPKLLMIGDSISEALRGTAIGEIESRTAGLQEALKSSSLAAEFPAPPPLILAISGDETQHQLWRLNATFGREFSPSLRADAHLFINLLIGTNNIANVNRHSVEETCDGVLAIARFLLRSNTHARLLLNAMLPRETDHPRRIVAGQPRPRARPTPQRSALELTRDLIRANELLRTDVIARLEAEFGARRVRFVDCGAPFRPHGWRLEDLNAQTYSVDGTLMPDGVHPSLNGSRLMADCLGDAFHAFRSRSDF